MDVDVDVDVLVDVEVDVEVLVDVLVDVVVGAVVWRLASGPTPTPPSSSAVVRLGRLNDFRRVEEEEEVLTVDTVLAFVKVVDVEVDVTVLGKVLVDASVCSDVTT